MISYYCYSQYKPTGIENKLSDIANLATKAALNTNASKMESKLPDITNLATKVALNTKSTEILDIASRQKREQTKKTLGV